MTNLHQYPARICQTAGGFLVHQDKILLVQHKKLHIWLAPGGHVEPGELPHQAAEREVFEETGVKVKVVSVIPLPTVSESEYLPVPFLINLHWISKDNYQARLKSKRPDQPHSTPKWPKGCEQHQGYFYLVKPVDSLRLNHDPNESDGIGWFGLTDLEKLETTNDIKREIQQVLNFTSTI